MADKLALIGSSESYLTIKQLAHGSARVKGTPEIVAGLLMFPIDDYASGADQVLVYEADRVEVTASADTTDIASVNVALGDKLYWDASASKITNVAAGNRFIGRALEAQDCSGGTVLGDTLIFSLEAANGFRVHCGTGTLDGSNPTPITHGLASLIGFTTQLIGSSAPGDNTSVLTTEAASATVMNVYAWKNTSGSDPTLVASTGTETFYWIAVGN